MLFVTNGSGHSKVSNFDVQVFVDENIFLLDVAVDYLILVDVVQSIQATEEYVQDFCLGEPSVFLSQLVTCKVAFRAVIYFGTDEFVRFKRAMEFYDVLVVLF